MIDDIKETLRKYITNNYLPAAKDYRIADADSFLGKGIIDSIGVIELTGFIQKTYNIGIKPFEIVPENFDTLNNLEAYVTKKLQNVK